ncbi:hypothetical protein CFter6_1696 [Collimonas fungivorans]|uniref:Uncharacterized protein n=1 Tax=Collimonas fungivorans TaxID=158899 RepID=A0A127P9G8_9BURK|nr:hypothetical protein CFter6_1696 [Collimonas fungivorans]
METAVLLLDQARTPLAIFPRPLVGRQTRLGRVQLHWERIPTAAPLLPPPMP